jgi:hypothetical protein
MVLRNIIFLVAIVSLTACSAPTFGLKPIYPENICIMHHNCEISFTEVDSIRPVFKWEGFPSEEVRRSSKAEVLNKITNVTYELNLWLSENDYPFSLIYSRRGLHEPRHEIEEPLMPCAKYFWTVRARFLVDGKERVSEWGISAWPWFWQDPKGYAKPEASGDEIVKRSPVVPHPNLYRFIAPCQEKAVPPAVTGIP